MSTMTSPVQSTPVRPSRCWESIV